MLNISCRQYGGDARAVRLKVIFRIHEKKPTDQVVGFPDNVGE
jgi:hypothetical protein